MIPHWVGMGRGRCGGSGLLCLGRRRWPEVQPAPFPDSRTFSSHWTSGHFHGFTRTKTISWTPSSPRVVKKGRAHVAALLSIPRGNGPTRSKWFAEGPPAHSPSGDPMPSRLLTQDPPALFWLSALVVGPELRVGELKSPPTPPSEPSLI